MIHVADYYKIERESWLIAVFERPLIYFGIEVLMEGDSVGLCT
jgi:hypothetical protein